MKKLKVVIVISVSTLIVLMGVYIVQQVGKASDAYDKRTQLPEFQFEQMNGQPFSRDSLKPATPTVVLFFDPDCEHCQEELVHVKAHIADFEGTQLLLVSAADRTRVIPFVKMQGFDALAPVRVLLTDAPNFEASFGTTGTPTTFFYSADGQLKEDFSGKVQPEGLKKGLDKIKP